MAFIFQARPRRPTHHQETGAGPPRTLSSLGQLRSPPSSFREAPVVRRSVLPGRPPSLRLCQDTTNTKIETRPKLRATRPMQRVGGLQASSSSWNPMSTRVSGCRRKKNLTSWTSSCKGSSHWRSSLPVVSASVNTSSTWSAIKLWKPSNFRSRGIVSSLRRSFRSWLTRLKNVMPVLWLLKQQVRLFRLKLQLPLQSEPRWRR